MKIWRLAPLAAALTAMPASSAQTHDGTYQTVIVKSTEACAALCKDDLKCRGWSYMQPDTRFPTAECRLNNGFGETPLFPPTPPAPWDLQTALSDLNAYRAQNGLAPLTLNAKLTAASQSHSDDLASFGGAAHKGSDGLFHDSRVKREGYNFSMAAENVATGQRSWDAAFKAWQESPGHNKNLLADNATEIGIALTYEPKTTYLTYWTMVLAAPL